MATQPTDTSKPRLRGNGDELTVIAQRAQAFTNASGTAIALSEGNVEEIVCRARSGSAAPEVGAALRVEGSFTGLCIQTGKELRCDDAETDTRVDTAAIRALGIRSMVVTPIREDNRVIGVLACFAPTAHAFTITHVAVLKTMADQIGVLLQKEKRNREEGIAPEVQPTQSKPVASAPVPLPPPVVIKSASAAAPARGPIPVVKAEPARASASVAFPRNEEKEKPEVRAAFGTFDAMTEPKSGGNTKMLGIVALMVVLVAGGSFYFLKVKKSTPTQQATNTLPGAQPVANGSSEGPNAAATSNGSPVISTGSVATSVPAANTRGSETGRVAAETARASERKPVEKPNSSARNADRMIAEDQPPQKPATVTLGGGQSHIPTSNAPLPQADVSANLTMAGNNASGALSALARPVSSSTPSVAQSELEPMKVVKTVQPIYPAIAKVRRLSGPVLVEVKVGKDGRVSNPKLISGQPVFRDAAFDAVKQWVFKPALLNGQPIEQTTQIKVVFSPQ